MNPISKEILEKYQIRKTKKQKTAFIGFLRAHFPELAVEEGGFFKNRNIVIGDVENAKVVFGAHYDTCAVLPIPNFIMPKNILVSILYGFVLAVPMMLIASLAGGIFGYITEDSFIGSYASLWVFWLLFILIFAGPANKHTVNDNTSGVITLIELLSTMPSEERAQCCFVFFDNEENGLLGSSWFEKLHKETMKDKLLINFDCVSDGDSIMLILNKRAHPEYAEKMKEAFAGIEDKTVLIESEKGAYYPSDQKNFKKNVGVAAFKKGRFGLYMDRIHTRRDTVMDERNIEVLVFGIRNFFKAI